MWMYCAILGAAADFDVGAQAETAWGGRLQVGVEDGVMGLAEDGL